MRAVVFHKPKDVRVEEWPDPKIEHPRDAVLRVTSTAICGSDLHMYNGTLPQLRPMVLGHEFMGVVEEVGPEVGNLSKGDRVVVPFRVVQICNRAYPYNRRNATAGVPYVPSHKHVGAGATSERRVHRGELVLV